jgi:hypothetical protein
MDELGQPELKDDSTADHAEHGLHEHRQGDVPATQGARSSQFLARFRAQLEAPQEDQSSEDYGRL